MTLPLHIAFPPLSFPVGGKGRGYWTEYARLAKDGISSVRVTPELLVRELSPGDHQAELVLVFAPESWPQERYGLIYGDPAFEAAVQAWWGEIGLEDGFGLPGYSEHGMQGEHHVGMECGSLGPDFSPQSAHQRLRLAQAAEGRGWTIAFS